MVSRLQFPFSLQLSMGFPPVSLPQFFPLAQFFVPLQRMVESIVVVVVVISVVVVTVDGVVVGDTGRRCRVASIPRVNSRPFGSAFL